jgi:uncharacterized protein YtpQ (UPF0354 family)
VKTEAEPIENERAECIVPLIKLCLPDTEPADLQLSADDSPVLEPFIGDLLIAYAFDLPSRYTLVQARHLADLRLSATELRGLATTNLRQRLPDIMRHQYPHLPVVVFTAGGNLESSLLLLDDLWEAQLSLVPGELVVSVPTRDCIAFTGSDSPEGIAELRASIDRAQAGGDHVLTRHLFVRRDSSWQSFNPK